jgi:ParB/RepB/Spo0J family partition protein
MQNDFDEKIIFELEPTSIAIHAELPRQRKDLGEIQKMAESIQNFGQLQPIVINRNNELIAGGRRLAACLILGIKARCCYKDTLDKALMRELELEENLQRKALTPSEECLAIEELVKLKQEKHGKPTSGKTGGFTLDNAAEMLGKTRGNVIEALQIAEMVKLFPELSKSDTKSEIKKAFKGLERVNTSLNALASYEETVKRTKEFVIVNREAEEWLAGLGENTVDLLITDPPYGIDVFKNGQGVGGKTGGELVTTGIKYEDGEDYAKNLLHTICKESFRIIKPTGFAYIFCAPSNFQWLSDEMKAAGWDVAPRPVVWIKHGSGQNNVPERWFSASYEFILFARKIDSSLLLQGRPDWIMCDPVNPSDRLHQAEKPVALLKELISRCCLPGQYLIDPCIGSGAVIHAGIELKMFSLGCEKSVESYATALGRLQKLIG